MDDLDFVNEYRKMKNLSEICKKFGADRSNLIKGNDKKNIHAVANVCRCEIIRMYNILILGEDYVNKTNSL